MERLTAANGMEEEKFRVIQNRIFEMRFLIGKLGSERVFPLLKEDNFEVTSDYNGRGYTKYDKVI